MSGCWGFGKWSTIPSLANGEISHQSSGLHWGSHPIGRVLSFKVIHSTTCFNSIIAYMVLCIFTNSDVSLLVKCLRLFLECEKHHQMEAEKQKGHCPEGRSHCLQNTRIKAYHITKNQCLLFFQMMQMFFRRIGQGLCEQRCLFVRANLRHIPCTRTYTLFYPKVPCFSHC